MIAWSICQRTGSFFSHVDFVLPDGGLLGALPGGGVQVRYPKEKLWRSLLMEVPVANGWMHALNQIGKPYDYLAIAGLALPFPRNWQDEHRWFCSELVAASLAAAGLPVVSSVNWGVSPRDLQLSPLLQLTATV